MKISMWLFLGMSCGLLVSPVRAQAAQIERPISFALTGFIQRTNSAGDFVAAPFRFTTKDVLFEISFATGQDFTDGALLWIESLDDTNAPLRIVARKGGNELDVYGTNVMFNFFNILGAEEAVLTERSFRGTVRSRIFYAIDAFEFSTLATTNEGRALFLQGFSKESQAAYTKTLGGALYSGFASTLTSDVIGELHDAIGLLGPVKGKFKIGPPKFVATAPPIGGVETVYQRHYVSMEMQSAGNKLPPLPPLPENPEP